MADVRASELIAKFESMIADKWGYILGKTHEMWSEAKQKNYNAAYKDNSKYAMSVKYGHKWYGHWVTDCSGAFAYWYKQLGGEMYHGSNTMYRSYCTAKGQLKGGKRTDGKELKPGTAVFTGTEDEHGHVGLYIGGGYVIEAKGAAYGVVKSKVTESRWTYWGELKGTIFDAGGDTPAPEPAPAPTPKKGEAVVTGKNVALRWGPTTSAPVITRIPTGTVVTVATPPDDWECIEYGGKKGYMMKEFIREG